MNKNLFYLIIAVLTLFVGSQTVSAQETKRAIIEAPSPTHDFGKIKEKDGSVKHDFVIINKGTAPLVITKVMSSCGCTTPKYSQEPIAPGKSSVITVVYDPTNRVYPFVKTVSVYSNGKDGAPLILTIKGVVE
ncbi:hypothetical protein HQ29_05965 [Porphyromonas canoris]|uniref:DUF1573 domain-containing protein n=1 Tax=Porphyromonas canoris TaxID=36875 RepID=UPI00051DA6D1|nr:DUF1573 domain-containing protein [Porphyromonas canoris]KGL52454.1 hypothetical protein HQ29_05965 [Porphyromonas canoris]